MRKIQSILILVVICAFMGSNALQAQEQEEKKKKKKTETMTCWASMDCENCKAKIEKNIAFEKGVKGLEVDLEKKLVKVEYLIKKTSPAKIEKAIKKLGFKTELIK